MARATGSFVLTASTDEDHQRMGRLVDEFSGRGVDGLLLAPPPGDQARLAAHLRRGMPLVLVDRPAEGIDVPAVLSDNAGGMRAAVRHLARHGHRRIAYLGDLRSTPMRQRYEGFLAGLAEHGLAPEPEAVRHDTENEAEAIAAVARLLAGPEPPTAIIAARNTLSFGAVRALRRAGAHHRVALLGFDDIDLADELDPGLTVVAQDPREIGGVAAGILLDLLADPAARATGRLLPTRLIPRGSAEIRPA
ncbi:LacI family transcriptional regulator [Streptomyces sp. PT12]|nr:substrate-binding domain-containing protein [Streptomyces sp. PT12]RBM24316.1 LacI family transcriptional regulator [Streptomyces sp. PT12]